MMALSGACPARAGTAEELANRVPRPLRQPSQRRSRLMHRSIGPGNRGVDDLVREVALQPKRESVESGFEDVARRRRCRRCAIGRYRRPRPPAVETEERCAMRVQDGGDEVASLLLLRKNHDHEASRAHVLHVMAKLSVLLHGPCQSNQRPLELREKPMFPTLWIQTMQVLISMKNIDVSLIDTGREQRL